MNSDLHIEMNSAIASTIMFGVSLYVTHRLLQHRRLHKLIAQLWVGFFATLLLHKDVYEQVVEVIGERAWAIAPIMGGLVLILQASVVLTLTNQPLRNLLILILVWLLMDVLALAYSNNMFNVIHHIGCLFPVTYMVFHLLKTLKQTPRDETAKRFRYIGMLIAFLSSFFIVLFWVYMIVMRLIGYDPVIVYGLVQVLIVTSPVAWIAAIFLPGRASRIYDDYTMVNKLDILRNHIIERFPFLPDTLTKHGTTPSKRKYALVLYFLDVADYIARHTNNINDPMLRKLIKIMSKKNHNEACNYLITLMKNDEGMIV